MVTLESAAGWITRLADDPEYWAIEINWADHTLSMVALKMTVAVVID
jgi:hypothetical protein